MKINIKHKPNKLNNEKSPYLLQHAGNPVDWYPWSAEAFELAEQEDKPVFLSIGYSTCHWCHVMAHESFEDEEIARMMNETFINIKVDREERPDIDNVYMDACHYLSGGGGWPMTIIMTPDKKPFFAGTYFPKESAYGRMGMRELIPKISSLWFNRKKDVYDTAEDLVKAIQENQKITGSDEFSYTIPDETYNSLLSAYDAQFGGFGNSPKFPIPHNITFLLRYFNKTKNQSALIMAENTLTKMSLGGIYDHIGFGFHRYSTDNKWMVPHFEKMLYDQALIIIAYCELWQVTRNDSYKNIIYEILFYVSRELTSPQGGFYTAEDADSNGIEGAFYFWQANELKELLADDYGFVKGCYNIREIGNISDSVSGNQGENILYLKEPYEKLFNEFGMNEDEFSDKLKKIRTILFERREKRIHPQKDKKILTDWNGLMAAAYAKAGRIFRNAYYIAIAKKSVDFVENDMFIENGRLLHCNFNGTSFVTANLDDYSFQTWGLLELYQTTSESKYLFRAIEMQEILFKHFWDESDGGFYFTADDSEKLFIRKKEIFDGAIPSGNSVELNVLSKLWHLTGNMKYREYSEKIISSFLPFIANMPGGYTQFMSGYIQAKEAGVSIVFVYKNKEDITGYLDILNEYYLTDISVLYKKVNDSEIGNLVPYVSEMKTDGDKPAVYICTNFICELPISDIDEFRKAANELVTNI